nr:unnamed protein product [Digitaria exilis]
MASSAAASSSASAALARLPGPTQPRALPRSGWRDHRRPRRATVRCSFAPVETARIKVVGVGGGGNNAVAATLPDPSWFGIGFALSAVRNNI